MIKKKSELTLKQKLIMKVHVIRLFKIHMINDTKQNLIVERYT